ncbi:MAG: porin, partial [Thiobacillus sp.]
MKKSLIALAVAGSFAAPAFAATSNVDIYGIFGASVDIIDRDISTQDNEFRLSSTASRIGFKGSEDLGGGLSAIWQVETALNIDTNAGGAWGSRNTFVGLSSKSLGTVRLGHYDTAYKMSTGRLDVFVDTLADYNTIMGSASGSNAAFDVREQNSISYETPDISGLKLMGTYGQRNEGGSKTLNPELWSLAATYANGPLFGALAYEIHKDVGVNRDVDAVKAALGYKFGSTTLGAAYEKIDDDAANSVLSRNAWYLSARH